MLNLLINYLEGEVSSASVTVTRDGEQLQTHHWGLRNSKIDSRGITNTSRKTQKETKPAVNSAHRQQGKCQ